MARNKSKSGWLLYTMIHLPLFWKFKVGITSLSIGAKKRANSIDRDMPGIPIPIMVVPVPGAYYIEQEMHRIMRRYNTVFYRGDGRTEWFNIAPFFFTVPIQLTIWFLYLCLLDMALGTTIAPVTAEMFFDFIFGLW